MYLSPTGVRTTWPPACLDDRLEAAIRQDRDDEAATRQRVARQPVESQDPEHLVAIDDLAGRIDRDEPVGIAVEREADVRSGRDDRLGERRRGRGARAHVDVDAVGLGMDDVEPGAGRGEDLRSDHRSRPVRRVEHEMEPARVDRPGEAAGGGAR